MHRATVGGGVRSLLVSVVKQPEKIESELLRHLVHVNLNRIKPDRIFAQQPILPLEHLLVEFPLQIIVVALAAHRVVSDR